VLVCIYSSTDPGGIEAGIVKNILDENKIENYIRDNHADNVWGGLMNLAIGGVKVMINENDVEKAMEILKEFFDNNVNIDNDEEEMLKSEIDENDNISNESPERK